MNRRMVLATSVMLPALLPRAALAIPIEMEQCGDCGGAWPENVWHWSEDMRLYKMYLGRAYGLRSIPLPPDAIVAGSITDPIVRAQLTPGQYADLGDMANLFGAGGALGTLAGGYVAGSRGMLLGGLYGLGAGLAFWGGWNFGTAIYRYTTGGGWSAVFIVQR